MTGPGNTGRRAVIIGGSMAGLFAGNILHRMGWQVDLYERVGDSLSARGAGIAAHPQSLPLLAAAGIQDDRSIGVPVIGRAAYGPDGEAIERFSYPQQLTSWSRVYSLLKQAFPAARYHAGRELVEVTQSAHEVTARFADGAAVEADLLIGADGIRSTVRRIFAPDIVPRYSGYVAWRGLVDEADIPERHRQELFLWFGFCFPRNGELVGYPIPGADEAVAVGARRYNFLWYRRASEHQELRDLLTDERGRLHEGSIPPPLIRRTHLDRLRDDARALLPPQFADVVHQTSQLLFQPIYDVRSEQLVFGRVALIGDAAFVARPHVGIGVLKAGEDAQTLAQAVSANEGVMAGLGRYQDERLPLGQSAVSFAQRLGAFLENGDEHPACTPEAGVTHGDIIRKTARADYAASLD